ncbi:hypothetical protein D3C80_1609980 [compost metagenome]
MRRTLSGQRLRRQAELQLRLILISFSLSCKDSIFHQSSDCFENRYGDRVAKLSISLSVRYRDNKFAFTRFVEAHQPGALVRRESARAIDLIQLSVEIQLFIETAINENFRAVLVISCR